MCGSVASGSKSEQVAYKARVHVQSEQFLTTTLCAKEMNKVRGGRVCSDTDPPYVKDERTGSVDQATCLVCIAKWQKLIPRGDEPRHDSDSPR